ncbi:MAG TPA: hypothetical protein PK772_08930, partial [Chitinophagaceae bacterium]|nr:hypothetical protein [Chitinophagaceae bacterium]
AYAYLQGELGVKVRLWFIKARIPIIKGGAAALLQAKLPNPSWFQGYLGVNFNVLGGLVKGNMRLKLTIGHECEIVSNSTSPIDVQVIADLTPKDKSMDIDVFSAPQASFNMRANQPFDMQDDNGNHTYRIKLEKLVVLNNNQEIPGRLEWNANEDAVTFYSTEILPPNKPLKALAKVTFEELKGGRWQTVYIDGKKSEELKEVSFTTGLAPTTIPNTNIDYAYPTVGQKNMYKDETPTGYIKLKRGQSYLFEDATGQALRFVSNANVTTTQAFSYDRANMQLNFNLPTVIKNQSTYLIDFYDNNKKSVTNENDKYNKTDLGEDTLYYAVKDKQADQIERGDMTKSILNYTFSTSKHNRFEDKMNSIRITDALAGRVTSDVINLQTEVADYEMFDIHELVGSAYTANKPLIQPFAILDDNYFTEDIFPRNYKTYPLAGDVTFKNRDTTLLGLYPIRALPLMTNYV